MNDTYGFNNLHQKIKEIKESQLAPKRNNNLKQLAHVYNSGFNLRDDHRSILASPNDKNVYQVAVTIQNFDNSIIKKRNFFSKTGMNNSLNE